MKIAIDGDIGHISKYIDGSNSYEGRNIEIISLNDKFHYRENEYVYMSFKMYFLTTQFYKKITEEQINKIEKIFSYFYPNTIVGQKYKIEFVKYFEYEEEPIELRVDVYYNSQEEERTCEVKYINYKFL